MQIVRRGVVESGHEARVVGDFDAVIAGQDGAHVGVIEQLREHPHVELAGLTTAGAAVQPRRVRVVARAAAVAGENHNRCETLGEGHGTEDAGDQPRLCRGVELAFGIAQRVVTVLAGTAVYRVFRIGAEDRLAEQLERIAQADRFHVAEGGGRRAGDR